MYSVMITATKEIPLKAKHHAAPSLTSAIPPSAGPITRARLNWMELSEIAFWRCSFGTSEGTSAEYDGPPKDCANAHDQRQAQNVPDMHHARKYQRGEHECSAHLDVLRHQQHFAAIMTVGDYAAQQRQEYDRDLPQKTVQAQEERRVIGEVVDQPGLRRRLHLGPDLGGAGARPHQAEVAELEGLKDTSKKRGRFLLGKRLGLVRWGGPGDVTPATM